MSVTLGMIFLFKIGSSFLTLDENISLMYGTNERRIPVSAQPGSGRAVEPWKGLIPIDTFGNLQDSKVEVQFPSSPFCQVS